jgi:hypothetical protein
MPKKERTSMKANDFDLGNLANSFFLSKIAVIFGIVLGIKLRIK